MLEFIAKCFQGSDAFTLSIFLKDGSQLLQCGLWSADATGIAIDDAEGEIRLIPWSSINNVTYQEG